ncbi:MAG: response regulator [Methanobacteriaceae archaeon]|jgi:CheY-like chemotaxis protein
MQKKPYILIIFNNPYDARLIKEILKEINFKSKIHFINYGKEAIKFLNKQEKYEETVTPDYILLDSFLPDIKGIELLKYIKHHDKLNTIPVIIISTSNDPEDINKAYKNHVDEYIIKPIDLDEYESSLKKAINVHSPK